MRILPFFIGLLLISCHSTSEKSNSESTETKQVPRHLVLQPCDKTTTKEIQEVKAQLQKHLTLYAGLESLVIEEGSHYVIPDSFVYKPRNRYLANKIIRTMSAENKGSAATTLRITKRDISAPAHNVDNYGIMGLSLQPGNAAIVSTYRLKDKKNLWKLVAHEYFHSLGLPHCPKNMSSCLIKDANKRDGFSETNALCPSCKEKLETLLRK